MRIPNLFVRSLGIAALGAALTVTGCGGDDDGGSGPTPSSEIDQGTASAQAQQMFSLVDGLMSSVTSLASGDFSELRAAPSRLVQSIDLRGDECSGEPVYDAGAGKWNYVCNYTSTEGSFAIDYTVQYLSGDTPQQFPDGSTTSFSYSMAMDFGFSFVNESSSSQIDMTYTNAMAVDGLQTDTLTLDGSGSAMGTITGNSGATAYNYAMDMSSTIAASVPTAGGCSTGTVGLTMNGYTGTATYGGGSSYAWTISKEGAGVVDSGTSPSACSI